MSVQSNQSALKNTHIHSPISPNNPKILLNTSTTRILTNNWESAASATAALAPVIPTATPQHRLQSPTVNPPQKRQNPEWIGGRERSKND